MRVELATKCVSHVAIDVEYMNPLQSTFGMSNFYIY